MARTRTGNSPTRAVDPEEPGLGFERVVFFSDAVFAIVITLLVLPLTAEVELPESGRGLAAAVLAQWRPVLTFAVSFLVVGQFWIAHHRTFGHLRRYDATLVWLNLVTLLTVAFMPFPAAVLGSHSTAADVFPVVFFAASMTLTSAMLTATWLYAARRGLTDDALAPAESARMTRRAFTTTAVFAASVAAAFLGVWVAIAFWLVLLPAARIAVAGRRRSAG